ncbi:hypothetical protein PMAYCL1PPCAC_16469, partial [Pristionchus mayeri]
LLQLKNSLHVTIEIEGVATAQHFQAITERAERNWKQQNWKKMRCWFTFEYEGERDFAFFERAHIANFVMDKRTHFHLTPENMQWLITLLRGCTVDKLSLIFEASTLPQL